MTTLGQALQGRFDDWLNVVLGMGGTRDTSTYTTIVPRAQLTDVALESLYVQDHFAAKIVEALPKEGLRPGWDLVVPGEPDATAKQRDAYAAREEELGVAAELFVGSTWGRLFGGALTWIGADDGIDPARPVDEESIESVRFLHTFDRRDVTVFSYYEDPTHPRFRRPASYVIRPRTQSATAIASAFGSTSGGAVVHETRCVVWGGQPTTDTRRQELLGWDDSILERCWIALREVAEDFGAKSHLLGRISQAIYKIKNLYKMIAGGQKQVLQERQSMLEFSRTRARAILLDLDEEYQNVTQPVGGIDLLLDRSILRLAAAADMPVSKLLGQALAGGASGDAEGALETWAANAESWRTLELRPRHEKITRMIILAKDGPLGAAEPDQWKIQYRPLRVPKAAEVASLRKTQAETDAIRIDKGMATAEAIAMARFTTSAGNDLVLDEAELKAALERRKELAAQPPKDNAELGTVGARATAAMDVVKQVAQKQIPRESGKAILVEMFRLKDETADQVLGPEDFEPAAPPPKGPTPGPDADPPKPGGAGAPPQLPGVNTGGDPRKSGTETEPDDGGEG